MEYFEKIEKVLLPSGATRPVIVGTLDVSDVKKMMKDFALDDLFTKNKEKAHAVFGTYMSNQFTKEALKKDKDKVPTEPFNMTVKAKAALLALRNGKGTPIFSQNANAIYKFGSLDQIKAIEVYDDEEQLAKALEENKPKVSEGEKTVPEADAIAQPKSDAGEPVKETSEDAKTPPSNEAKGTDDQDPSKEVSAAAEGKDSNAGAAEVKSDDSKKEDAKKDAGEKVEADAKKEEDVKVEADDKKEEDLKVEADSKDSKKADDKKDTKKKK